MGSGYSGSVDEKGMKHGMGYDDYEGGHHFSGKFYHGRPDEGTLTYRNVFAGHSYTGKFCRALERTDGTMTYPDGSKYTGKWDDDKMHGMRGSKGIMTYRDGSKYEGEWARTFLVGKRTKCCNHRPTCTTNPECGNPFGDFDVALGDMKIHGDGRFTFPNGDYYWGKFENGKMHDNDGSYYFADHETYDERKIWKNVELANFHLKMRKARAQKEAAEKQERSERKAAAASAKAAYLSKTKPLEKLSTDDIYNLVCGIDGLNAHAGTLLSNGVNGTVICMVKDAEELKEFGLPTMHSRILFSKVEVWKKEGVAQGAFKTYVTVKCEDCNRSIMPHKMKAHSEEECDCEFLKDEDEEDEDEEDKDEEDNY